MFLPHYIVLLWTTLLRSYWAITMPTKFQFDCDKGARRTRIFITVWVGRPNTYIFHRYDSNVAISLAWLESWDSPFTVNSHISLCVRMWEEEQYVRSSTTKYTHELYIKDILLLWQRPPDEPLFFLLYTQWLNRHRRICIRCMMNTVQCMLWRRNLVDFPFTNI